MTNLNQQLNDYVNGKVGTDCPHPLNRIAAGDNRDYCSVCGKVVWAQAFADRDQLPTDIRASKADIEKMWARLFGKLTPSIVRQMYDKAECKGTLFLDLTQRQK